MPKGRETTLLESIKTLWEYRWLFVLVATMLSAGTAVGVSILDKRYHEQIAPLVDLIIWDFDKRGVLADYKQHRDTVESNRKLILQRDAAASPYPPIPRAY